MIELTHSAIDVAALADGVQTDADGAVVTFVGVVRNHARSRHVHHLEYQAYEPMALRVLQQIGGEAARRWPVRTAVSHRLGRLEIGEVSVAIAVASPHRAEAFEACRYIIERIKAEAPIWKKEFYDDGAEWIEEAQCGTDSPGPVPDAAEAAGPG